MSPLLDEEREQVTQIKPRCSMTSLPQTSVMFAFSNASSLRPVGLAGAKADNKLDVPKSTQARGMHSQAPTDLPEVTAKPFSTSGRFPEDRSDIYFFLIFKKGKKDPEK